MAAFNFPNSPSTNDLHTENGVTYKWNGTVWKRQNASYTDATNLNVTGISTVGSITGVAATFTGNVQIGGVLTYEDVKNVDSVGIVTARTGIHIDDSITHIGDTNTKIRFPAADTVSVETGGTERLSITTSEVQIKGDASRMLDLITTSGTGSCYMQFSDSGGQKGYLGYGSGGNEVFYIVQNENAQIQFYSNSHTRAFLNPDGKFNFDRYNGTAGLGRIEFGASGEQYIEGYDTGNAGSGSYLRFGDGGAEHLRITSAGNVGVGTDVIGAWSGFTHSNGSTLVLNSFGSNSNWNGQIRLGASSGFLIDHNASSTTTTTLRNLYGATNAAALTKIESGTLTFHTGTGYTERLRIDSDGRLLVNTTSAMTTGSNDLRDTIQATHTAGAQLLLARNDTATITSNRLGEIAVLGNDSNGTYQVGASMRFEADANHGDNDKPTRILFKTCADGSATLTERLRITSGGQLNIGGESTQTTHMLHLQSTGDAGIHIRADSDNSGENDNPYLSMSQDSSTAQQFKIGLNGEGGQNFTTSLGNSPFIHANNSASQPLQLVHMDTMVVSIANRKNEIALNDYSGNSVAGMEIQHYGNDTAAALKFTGHNNTGTPGAETYTQLTHKGANAEFEIHHVGSRAMNIGPTRRIRVPGVWGVNGSSMRTVQIESDGNLCAPSSIREAKINIESISDVSWLYDFNPVTFNFRTKTEVNGENVWGDEADDGGLQYGLIADEVEAVNQDLCFYDDGKLSGVHYDRMMSPLIKAVQDQKKEIDALKAKVAALEGS